MQRSSFIFNFYPGYFNTTVTECHSRHFSRHYRLAFSADSEMVSVRDSALAWRFFERWPDLESAQNVSRQLKAFFTRDARSCPANVDQLINQIREAIPATQDRAVVNSSAVFVQGIVGELQLVRTTIQKYEKQIEAIVQQHPDFSIVSSFPGIGKALAPRLIAALGTQRERFPNAASIQSYSGIAPVREASGKREWVHARWACPKFLKQTFQEWAQHSLARSAWAHKHYDRTASPRQRSPSGSPQSRL